VAEGRAPAGELSFPPMIGNADFPRTSTGRGTDLVGKPANDETAAVRWVPLDEVAAMIATGNWPGPTSSVSSTR